MRWLDEAEPKLEEALADPIILAMMTRDGVDADALRNLARRLRERLERRRRPAA
jgi:hypothetical protein